MQLFQNLETKKKKIYTAFLDRDKMFGNIIRSHLWQKFISHHVSTKPVKAFQAMYATIISYIKSTKPRIHNISNIGVKQGDPASSLLCLFILNDIATSINSNFENILYCSYYYF
jgi:hypothetical protein